MSDLIAFLVITTIGLIISNNVVEAAFASIFW
ncbi:hypothetical protein DFR47_10786 [Pseudochrobactrum asaccharolyticum]|jgi:hypothetical protein|uniref:Uncharacterized protein n=1 Tax=Pseudochrobactrum asaccharolyticum TaxID=354351 RepID=A0A366DQ30_9HYPH|nr:hypothetical protein DFR47_10786 [Pseudochrobactrum asaccharolyticum]